MKDNLRNLRKRTGDASDSESDEEARRKRRAGPSQLEQELAKYKHNRGRAVARAANSRRKKEEEEDLLAEMAKFSQKVSASETAALEPRDEDDGWLGHKLKFEVDEKELTRRAEDEYSVSYRKVDANIR